jgi:hypothetical protein
MFPVMTGALLRIDPFTFTSLRYLIAGARSWRSLFSRKDGAPSTSKVSARRLAIRNRGLCRFQLPDVCYICCARARLQEPSDGFDQCGVRQCCSTARARRMSEMCLINKEERDYA